MADDHPIPEAGDELDVRLAEERDLVALDERLRLVELLDRVLDKGVVLRGDVTISVAGIDLVYLELHLLLASVESLRRRGGALSDESGS